MIQSLAPGIPHCSRTTVLLKIFGLGAVPGQPTLFPTNLIFWLERVIQSEGQITGGFSVLVSK